MKNIIIGIFLVVLYLGNKQLCDFFYADNIEKYWYLNHAILTICIVLAIKFKESGNFIEKLFISMVLNNVYVLIVKQEIQYTLNDFWFIAIFTLAQYIKVNKTTNEQDI